MTRTGANKFQAFSIQETGYSQPCAINSPSWGGHADDINVQAMTDVSLYQSCLPNFLAFDQDINSRQAWSDVITCPNVVFVIPNATNANDTEMVSF